jgi:hypothetical protein
MFKMGWKLNFSIFFEELIDPIMWLILPMGYREGAKN